MAQYRLAVQTIQRSAGRSAVAAAAYRSGDRLIDERLAMECDFGSKGDIEFAAIMAPADLWMVWTSSRYCAMRPPPAAPPWPLPGSLRAAPLAQGFLQTVGWRGLEGVGRGLTAGLVGAAHPTRNCALVMNDDEPRHRPICTFVAV